jgi:hypothetical protein
VVAGLAPILTVATYLNDVPVPAADFNIASFDIRQLEVLRGAARNRTGHRQPVWRDHRDHAPRRPFGDRRL